MKKFAISFLSRLGGYNPGTLGQFQRDDHEPILKFGLAVLLSALISAFNWSMGTWTLTDGVSFYYRILMTLCLGFFGFVLVAALWIFSPVQSAIPLMGYSKCAAAMAAF